MSKFKVGTVVQIVNMDGFAERTVKRFQGRCCIIEALEPGLTCDNATVRIMGVQEGESFSTLHVKTSRLKVIKQFAKGTNPLTGKAMKTKRARYTQKDGDVFRMTGKINRDLAGCLHEVPAGGTFRLAVVGASWKLVYLGQKQDNPHYTDRNGDWINELLDAGVIERVLPVTPKPLVKVGDRVEVDASGFMTVTRSAFVGAVAIVIAVDDDGKGFTAKAHNGREAWFLNQRLIQVLPKPALADAFGPVPVDEWSYNSTTFDGLARGEVAELRSTISAATTGRLMFTHVRRADLGVWVHINPNAMHAITYLSRHGVADSDISRLKDSNGWMFLPYVSKAVTESAFLRNGSVVFITAFEYPAMYSSLEASFSDIIDWDYLK